MPAVGDKLANKYRLVRSIGEGGMGAVFEAEHEELGKQVAIKLLHPEYSRDKDGVARFKREARAAAATGHPAIIDIYDLGQADDGALFLVMELLRGASLADTLRNEGSLDIPTTTYIICEVLAALQDAHRATIIHRDIKPDNIFLVRTGKRLPDVKLLDFGASRFIDPADPVRRLTRSGIIMGTPQYLAPEQVEGKTQLDLRVDIYASGVVLYEALTGKLPFTGDTVLAIMRDIADGQFVLPRELLPSIPAELEAVILKAMARDRKKRFNSAGAMLEALLPFLAEGMSDRISLPERFPRPSQAGATKGPRKSLPRPRTSKGAWLGLGIVLMLIMLGFGQIWSFRDEPLEGRPLMNAPIFQDSEATMTMDADDAGASAADASQLDASLDEAEDSAFEQPDASLDDASLDGNAAYLKAIRPSTPSPPRRSRTKKWPRRRRERPDTRLEAPIQEPQDLTEPRQSSEPQLQPEFQL